MSILILIPVKPSGLPLAVEVVGDVADSGGVGGWTAVDRPQRRASTEWTGLPERIQSIPIAIDGRSRTGRNDLLVEARCRLLEGWCLPTLATEEPPVLSIIGPAVYGTNRRWVINDLEKGPKIFDGHGRRISQDYTLVLREYLAPVVIRSVAKKVRDKHNQGNQ